MKYKTLLFVMVFAWGRVQAAPPAGVEGSKVIECPYLPGAPYGVLGWSQSGRLKDPKTSDSRFVDYNSEAARNLILDATTERDVTRDEQAKARTTTFSTAYDERGWFIYVEAEEPLLQPLLDSLADPKSPALGEGYEIFFAPGLHNVPYYQVMTKTFGNTPPNLVDWGMPHRHYRSLKDFIKVESLPLEKRSGTFLFIPWEALYEWAPFAGDYWRFSIIRWMPFGKAGGVTWGGKVHETGNFGLVHFLPPPDGVRQQIEKRLLRSAWFKFRAEARDQADFWSDPKLGDADFYEKVLKPEIEKSTAAGEAMGEPEGWTAEGVAASWKYLGDWMEFRYKVAELRDAYLVDKRFAETH